ncbi:phenol hydroxylase P1 protein [Azospirillum agricola]|uniref:aromatic/alkene monooxygenase hydroxylase subunit beta n=1 Tax=Azospirillum agricola TaxID=1720247 RepID=UPI001AE5AA64|nr:aromatic/alkene monooxygenase hydroxylase subunit beta [Azospirillum agricola]MBP2227914.1 phenol hydroxylase P1 protein [Azospirillum agricola]
MTIEIKTLKVEPRRQTFGHVARRLGADKPASRYDEATMDVQATANFHYKPLWDAEFWHYDERRTAIRMRDWYALRDPRQFYYASYNIARAAQHQGTERNFDFVEKRGLLALLDPAWRETVEGYLLPLRHMEWGANMNCANMCDRGYGTAVTAPAMFAAGDHLGMAQIVGRIGLALDGNSGASLDAAKQRWMEAPDWQELRRLTEDSLVIGDWFEQFVAQHLAIDGMLYPLVYGRFDAAGQALGGTAVSMLTGFMTEWHAEHGRWVDAVVKTAAAESAENRALLGGWLGAWSRRAAAAFAPLAAAVLGPEAGADAIAETAAAIRARAVRLGLDPLAA